MYARSIPVLYPLLSLLSTLSTTGHAELGTGARAPFQVSVHVEWESADRLLRRVLRPGQDALHAGDHFRIHASSDQPVYVYLLETDPVGGASLLFPLKEHMRVTEPLRVPATGLYRVEGSPGEYKLAVFASREPMSQAQCEKLALRCPLFPEGGSSQTTLHQVSLLSAAPGHGRAVAERAENKDAPPATKEEPKTPEKKESDSPPKKEPVEPAPIAGQTAKDGTRGGAKRADSRTGFVTTQSDEGGTAFVSLTFYRHR